MFVPSFDYKPKTIGCDIYGFYYYLCTLFLDIDNSYGKRILSSFPKWIITIRMLVYGLVVKCIGWIWISQCRTWKDWLRLSSKVFKVKYFQQSTKVGLENNCESTFKGVSPFDVCVIKLQALLLEKLFYHVIKPIHQ